MNEDDRIEEMMMKEVEAVLACYQKLFEDRYEHMKEHILQALKFVEHDRIIETMRSDPTTREFVLSRLKELMQVRTKEEKKKNRMRWRRRRRCRFRH